MDVNGPVMARFQGGGGARPAGATQGGGPRAPKKTGTRPGIKDGKTCFLLKSFYVPKPI